MKRVVILGGGSGGAVAARALGTGADPDELEVVLIDRSPWHHYQPSFLWVMNGKRQPDDVRRPLKLLEDRYGTTVVEADVTAIDPAAGRVETDGGDYDYDYLIVSLGSVLAADEMAAGVEAPWTLENALAVRERLAAFEGGRVVVGAHSWPYRCPPAPFEVAFMLRYLAEMRGVLDRTEVTVFHPWQKPMETFGPAMIEGFERFLEDYDVGFEGGFELTAHDREEGILRSADGRELPYDFAVVVPSHAPPPVVAASPLATETGYMDVELPSMRSPAHENVFGIGDVVAPTIGLGMAGVFAHFQAQHVSSVILDEVRGVRSGDLYNMIGICVMDTGYMGAAVWCDFTEKLFGRSEIPDCRMLGGMGAFRALKVGFERLWFTSLFGPGHTRRARELEVAGR